MKSVFLSGGAREAALRLLLERNEPVAGVITPKLSRSNRRFLGVVEVAVEFGVPVIPVSRETLPDVLDDVQADLLISCGFPYILAPQSLAKFLYAINVHPTLLPKYRGFRSGAHIVMNGERVSGVSVHWLTDGMDSGDILDQVEFPLTVFDTTSSVYRKARELEPELLWQVVQRIKNGDLSSRPQDESSASVFNDVRTPEDSEIDWNRPLVELYDQIRACDPEHYPAFFFVEGEKVCVRLWRPTKPESEADMI